MFKDKFCIIIPSYNEAATLAKVIKSIKFILRSVTIVVINDGSTDDTAQIARNERVNLVNLPFNLGIGGSVQTGIKYAYQNNFNRAIQVDADGQHDPKYIVKLLNESLNSNTDLIIGSRYLKKTFYRTPFIRRLGISIFTFLIKLVTGKKIADSTSGFRVFNRKALRFLSRYYPVDFPEPESIVQLLKNGLTIKEVPVEMHARLAGESSVTWLKAIYFMMSISIAILVQALKKPKII